jgi:hypothetical protein
MKYGRPRVTDVYDYNTKYGKLSTLKVKYFSYGLYNMGGTCGPFKTREEAVKHRGDETGLIFESEVEGLEALEILEKLDFVRD